MPGPELGFLHHTGGAIGRTDLAYRLGLVTHDHHQPLWRQHQRDLEDVRE